MTLPDYGLWALIGFGALGLFTLFALGRALLGRMRMAAGMRFPVGDRAAGIKPGLRARLVHMPMGLRAITLVLLLAAARRPFYVSGVPPATRACAPSVAKTASTS